MLDGKDVLEKVVVIGGAVLTIWDILTRGNGK